MIEDKPKQFTIKLQIHKQTDGKQLTNNCIEKFVERLRNSEVLNFLVQYSLIVLQTISLAVNRTYTN